MRTLKYLFTVPKGETVTEKYFRRVLIASVCSILLCMSCLAGTTWAWFTTTLNVGTEITLGKVDIKVTASADKDGAITESPATLEKGTYRIKLENAGNMPGYGDILLKTPTESKILRTGSMEPEAEAEYAFTLILGTKAEVQVTSCWGIPESNTQTGTQPEGESTATQQIPVVMVNHDDTVAVATDIRTITYVAALENVENVEKVIGASDTYKLPDYEEIFGAVPEGKTFRCWSIGDKLVKPAASHWFKGEITVTAVWEDATVYTVTFLANNGTEEKEEILTGSAEFKLPECKFTAPADQSFKAWKIGETEHAAGDTVTFTADTEVTALWQPKPVTFTVTFEANGGTGTMAPVSDVSGTYTLPGCTFTAPEGQTFKAWKIGETEYAPGASYTVNADTTVTAVWEQQTQQDTNQAGDNTQLTMEDGEDSGDAPDDGTSAGEQTG